MIAGRAQPRVRQQLPRNLDPGLRGVAGAPGDDAGEIAARGDAADVEGAVWDGFGGPACGGPGVVGPVGEGVLGREAVAGGDDGDVRVVADVAEDFVVGELAADGEATAVEPEHGGGRGGGGGGAGAGGGGGVDARGEEDVGVAGRVGRVGYFDGCFSCRSVSKV